MPNIALYHPDIAQNVGAAMRLAACTNTKLHIIEPCGFPWNERKIRQSGLDYIDYLTYTRHESWDKFRASTLQSRIILMTTKADQNYLDFSFQEGDILLAGSESSGVPEDIHRCVDARIKIKMNPDVRSLNIINATAMILGEAIRQARP